MNVAIVGNSIFAKEQPIYELSYQIGRYLTQNDHTVIFDDREALKGSVYSGASDQGGSIILISSSPLTDEELGMCDKNYVIEDLIDQIHWVYNESQMIIILPGGPKTLLYLSYILYSNRLSERKAEVVLVGREWASFLATLKNEKIVNEGHKLNIIINLSEIKTTSMNK